MVDGAGNITGAALPSNAQVEAVEATETLQCNLWQYNKTQVACDPNHPAPFVHHVFPMCRNRQIGGKINAEPGKGSELTMDFIVENTE